jgi:hypothetical protein
MYFTSDTQYCEKLEDDFHLTHLHPYKEILEKISYFKEWPNHHIASHVPSFWVLTQKGIDFFDSVYGKNNWMSMVFRVPPKHVTGRIHSDGTNDTYNFVVQSESGCTRWFDESKLTVLYEMQNFVNNPDTKNTKIYEDSDDFIFETDDKAYPNNHLHIDIPHRVCNFSDRERIVVAVRVSDPGIQERVDRLGELILMNYYVGRDWDKPMDVNEWLDNYIKEKFNNN